MRQTDIATSREVALATDKPFYIGSKPCQHGHDPAIRRTGSKACHQCGLEYDRKRRASDPLRQESERKRKRALIKRQKAQGTFNKEQKRRDDRARRERQRNTPEAIAKREAREADAKARREARQLQAEHKREVVALNRVLRELAKHERAPMVQARKVERERNKARKRRALKRGASGSVDNSTLATMRAQQDDQCAYCGSEIEHLDHKTSVANGGQHEADNLQWLCAPCNLHKHAMNDDEYRERYGIPSVTPWDNMAGRALWLGLFSG